MNRHRESSVYIQTTDSLPDLTRSAFANRDQSFVGDGMDHSVPVKNAAAVYGGLIRELENQYGSMISQSYVDLGLIANGFQETIGGPVGDIHIGLYSVRRTSYVSNKVGPANFTGTYNGISRPLKLFGNSDILIFDILSYSNPHELPESGDTNAGKNYSNLHKGRDWDAASEIGNTEQETYFPKFQKTLVHFWTESEVSPYLRKIGEGEGEVYYPQLKQLDIDSKLGTGNWEQGYLNRLYWEVVQPSISQQFKKSMLKALVNIIVPMVGVTELADINSDMELTATLAASPIFVGLWFVLNKFLLNPDFLNKLVGIRPGISDDEGGEKDSYVRQFEDNYHEYNLDYSRVNMFNPSYGMGSVYNTCDCGDDTSNEIFYSDRQVTNSSWDAYKSFKSNNYLALPATSGSLVKLFTNTSGSLYAHTTDSIFPIQFNNNSIPTQLGQILMGTGDLLSAPQALSGGLDEGYAGLQYHNQSVDTPVGYFFVDSKSNTPYLFGQQLEPLTYTKGMFGFFRDFLSFCEEEVCRDERIVEGSDIIMGYDGKTKRLLITKKESIQGVKMSWTLSYSLLTQKWRSFHDYIPQDYLWSRKDMLTLTKGNEVWLHNNSKNSFQKFYGEYKPVVLDFIHTNLYPKELNHIEVKTEFTEIVTEATGLIKKLYNRRKTFTSIWLRTSFQSTSEMDIVPYHFDEDDQDTNNLLENLRDDEKTIRASLVKKKWRLNEFHDFTVDKNLSLDICEECILLEQPNEENEDSDQALKNQNFKHLLIEDEYYKIRLTLNAEDDDHIKMTLHSCDIHYNKEVR